MGLSHTVTTAKIILWRNQTLGLRQTEVTAHSTTCPTVSRIAQGAPVLNTQAYWLGGSKISALLMVSGASLQFPQKHTISPYPKPVKPKVHKSLEPGSPGDSVRMVASDIVDTTTAVFSFT
jgi:hypothetical protein